MYTYRIVVGVDGSQGGRRALLWAAHQARVRDGFVRAVMVYERVATEATVLAGIGPDYERLRAENIAAEALADLAMDYPDVRAMSEALPGRTARVLADVARHADLLVVGGHGHGRLRRAVLGSVSQACVRLAPCPVVVVPEPRTALAIRPAPAVRAPAETRSRLAVG